jgi:hypothetical protein
MSDALRDRLAEIEAEHATLQAELRAFQADYMRQVGTIMAQVQDLEARILEIVAERSGAPGDREAAATAGRRAERTYAEMRAVPVAGGPLPSGNLKRLFRDAAKRMHPDLVRDAEGRTHAEAFMKRLNQAYRAVDADAIRDLVLQWDASPFAPAAAAGEPHGLEAAVARAEHRLALERDSELARIMERAMTAAAAGIDLLAEMRADAQAALAVRRERLAELTGPGSATRPGRCS